MELLPTAQRHATIHLAAVLVWCSACFPRVAAPAPPQPLRACEVVGTLEAERSVIGQLRAIDDAFGGEGTLIADEWAVLRCPCLKPPALAAKGEESRVGSRVEDTRVGGVAEEARLRGATEQARIGEADESSRIGGLGDEARVGSRDESSQIRAADESTRVGAADESARVGAVDEEARVRGADEAARVGSAAETARHGGAGQVFQCRVDDSPLGMAIISPTRAPLRWLYDGGLLWDISGREPVAVLPADGAR